MTKTEANEILQTDCVGKGKDEIIQDVVGAAGGLIQALANNDRNRSILPHYIALTLLRLKQYTKRYNLEDKVNEASDAILGSLERWRDEI